MKEDVFPATLNTWIRDQLVAGDLGRSEVNRHIMSVYFFPLRTYFLGTSERWLGEPEEIIQGFFADRLAREGFFTEWERSGKRLRRWLITAFNFYLKEVRRRKWRDGRAGPVTEEPVSFKGDPEREVDRAFVVSVVQQAIDRATEMCKRENLDQHWDIFERHYCRGVSYNEIADDLKIDAARAAVMARTAGRKFKTALRDLLEKDAANADVDSEIMALLEIM